MSLSLQPAPIHYLPLEIISLILTASIPPIYDTGPAGESRFYFPAFMSRVCRRFRQVVLSTPSLWSFLYLNSSADEAELAHIRDRINHKSGKVLLDIYLLAYKEGFRNTDIRTTLSACSTRWRSFSMCAPYNRNRGPYLRRHTWNLLRIPTPQLHTITITAPVAFRFGPLEWSLPFSFPSTVRSLEIRNCNFSWGPLNFKFPSSLETLTIFEGAASFQLESVTRALEPLQYSLRSLSLGGFGLSDWSDDNQVHATCTLESLKSLEVTGMPALCMIRLLTHIKAPSMVRLSIRNPSFGNSEPYTPAHELAIFQGWKETRFPKLTDLDLDTISSADGDLVWIEFLQNLAHSVTHLLANSFGDDDEATKLLKDHRLDPFFRQLKQLTTFGLSAAGIVSIINGRCCSLEWLQVCNSDITLTQGHTKAEFEDNTRDVEHLKSLVDLRVELDNYTRLGIPTFATWEECEAYKAEFDLAYE